ncbi:MAG: vanadium-dependent haloperoxidase, partial [Gammaproteobacteria bacterium]|nr:vanadium-dependent haloperoxidase [Gammaproteobacteria bacterium]
PDYPAGQGGYVYINPPMAVTFDGITDGSGHTVVDINRWQRLQIVNAVDQNGFPQGPIQNYLGVQWLGVKPYQLARIDSTLPWIDPGPPPFFGTATHAQFVKEVVAVIRASSQLDPDDGATIDISPAVYGNNSLDFSTGEFPDVYDGTGYKANPATGAPYAPNVVKRGDYARVLSEFWADGPSSETPPGHWNVIANTVADSPLLSKQIGGKGPVVDDLEWDVKTYFAVNAATHEAACACWGIKRYYDAWRPMSAIRYLGGLGQSSNPALPAYNAKGLPLINNLIELVTDASSAFGERHEGLTPGTIAIYCWPGETPQRVAPNGVHWLPATTWTTYQRTNFVVPAFPGYISGHSTFSRSAAEVLTAITGSEFFPGGLGVFSFPQDTALRNEKGPTATVELRYATYFDAADGAGLSRIYGGIHPPIDNLGGRRVGAMTGKGVWEAAHKYFDGSISQSPVNMALKKVGSNKGELRFNTLRAMYYRLQSAPGVAGPFTDLPGGPIQALDSSIATTNSLDGFERYFRAIRTLTP